MSAPESHVCSLLSNHAGRLRVRSQSLRLRIQRFGTRDFPQERVRFRPQPERELEAIRANGRRPNASGYGARRGIDTATMYYYRSPRGLLPEGILSQRLHEEPQASRPVLQEHA